MVLSPTHLKELCDAGDLGIKVNTTEFQSFIKVFSMNFLCQFGQNLVID